MRNPLVFLLLCVASLPLPMAAVDGDRALYVGGSIAGLAENQEGTLNTSTREGLQFHWAKGTWQVPYKSILKIEYGNKPGRQVAAAILVSPAFLAAKKKKHFLTLHVKDAGGNLQAGVFELSKGRYEQIIADLEEKTGTKVEYENPPRPAQKTEK